MIHDHLEIEVVREENTTSNEYNDMNITMSGDGVELCLDSITNQYHEDDGVEIHLSLDALRAGSSSHEDDDLSTLSGDWSLVPAAAVSKFGPSASLSQQEIFQAFQDMMLECRKKGKDSLADSISMILDSHSNGSKKAAFEALQSMIFQSSEEVKEGSESESGDELTAGDESWKSTNSQKTSEGVSNLAEHGKILSPSQSTIECDGNGFQDLQALYMQGEKQRDIESTKGNDTTFDMIWATATQELSDDPLPGRQLLLLNKSYKDQSQKSHRNGEREALQQKKQETSYCSSENQIRSQEQSDDLLGLQQQQQQQYKGEEQKAPPVSRMKDTAALTQWQPEVQAISSTDDLEGEKSFRRFQIPVLSPPDSSSSGIEISLDAAEATVKVSFPSEQVNFDEATNDATESDKCLKILCDDDRNTTLNAASQPTADSEVPEDDGILHLDVINEVPSALNPAAYADESMIEVSFEALQSWLEQEDNDLLQHGKHDGQMEEPNAHESGKSTLSIDPHPASQRCGANQYPDLDGGKGIFIPHNSNGNQDADPVQLRLEIPEAAQYCEEIEQSETPRVDNRFFFRDDSPRSTDNNASMESQADRQSLDWQDCKGPGLPKEVTGDDDDLWATAHGQPSTSATLSNTSDEIQSNTSEHSGSVSLSFAASRSTSEASDDAPSVNQGSSLQSSSSKRVSNNEPVSTSLPLDDISVGVSTHSTKESNDCNTQDLLLALQTHTHSYGSEQLQFSDSDSEEDCFQGRQIVVKQRLSEDSVEGLTIDTRIRDNLEQPPSEDSVEGLLVLSPISKVVNSKSPEKRGTMISCERPTLRQDEIGASNEEGSTEFEATFEANTMKSDHEEERKVLDYGLQQHDHHVVTDNESRVESESETPVDPPCLMEGASSSHDQYQYQYQYQVVEDHKDKPLQETEPIGLHNTMATEDSIDLTVTQVEQDSDDDPTEIEYDKLEAMILAYEAEQESSVDEDEPALDEPIESLHEISFHQPCITAEEKSGCETPTNSETLNRGVSDDAQLIEATTCHATQSGVGGDQLQVMECDGLQEAEVRDAGLTLPLQEASPESNQFNNDPDVCEQRTNVLEEVDGAYESQEKDRSADLEPCLCPAQTKQIPLGVKAEVSAAFTVEEKVLPKTESLASIVVDDNPMGNENEKQEERAQDQYPINNCDNDQVQEESAQNDFDYQGGESDESDEDLQSIDFFALQALIAQYEMDLPSEEASTEDRASPVEESLQMGASTDVEHPTLPRDNAGETLHVVEEHAAVPSDDNSETLCVVEEHAAIPSDDDGETVSTVSSKGSSTVTARSQDSDTDGETVSTNTSKGSSTIASSQNPDPVRCFAEELIFRANTYHRLSLRARDSSSTIHAEEVQLGLEETKSDGKESEDPPEDSSCCEPSISKEQPKANEASTDQEPKGSLGGRQLRKVSVRSPTAQSIANLASKFGVTLRKTKCDNKPKSNPKRRERNQALVRELKHIQSHGPNMFESIEDKIQSWRHKETEFQSEFKKKRLNLKKLSFTKQNENDSWDDDSAAVNGEEKMLVWGDHPTRLKPTNLIRELQYIHTHTQGEDIVESIDLKVKSWQQQESQRKLEDILLKKIQHMSAFPKDDNTLSADSDNVVNARGSILTTSGNTLSTESFTDTGSGCEENIALQSQPSIAHEANGLSYWSASSAGGGVIDEAFRIAILDEPEHGNNAEDDAVTVEVTVHSAFTEEEVLSVMDSFEVVEEVVESFEEHDQDTDDEEYGCVGHGVSDNISVQSELTTFTLEEPVAPPPALALSLDCNESTALPGAAKLQEFRKKLRKVPEQQKKVLEKTEKKHCFLPFQRVKLKPSHLPFQTVKLKPSKANHSPLPQMREPPHLHQYRQQLKSASPTAQDQYQYLGQLRKSPKNCILDYDWEHLDDERDDDKSTPCRGPEPCIDRSPCRGPESIYLRSPRKVKPRPSTSWIRSSPECTEEATTGGNNQSDKEDDLFYDSVSISFLASVKDEVVAQVLDEALFVLRTGGILNVLDMDGSAVKRIQEQPKFSFLEFRKAASASRDHQERHEAMTLSILEKSGLHNRFDAKDPRIVHWTAIKQERGGTPTWVDNEDTEIERKPLNLVHVPAASYVG